MNIGEWVRQQCTAQGITVSQLAREIGCSQALIIHWRERDSIPKTYYFLKVCLKIAQLRQEHPQTIIREAAEIIGIKIPQH